MTMAATFKQFFTPAKYSQILINELNISSPEKIIDLAIGEGALLIEAKKRWDLSHYYGNDIDLYCCKKITTLCPNLHCTNFDVLKYNTINKISSITGKVDLCLGNPPFHKIKKDKDIDRLLAEFDLQKYNKGKYIPSEIPFILQNLKILKDNGTLALILPDGFFTNESLAYFRKFLFFNYHIEKIVELPSNIFKNTPAKTHIMILKKSFQNQNYNIILSNLDGKKIKISTDEAITRSDFSFNYINNQILPKKAKKLKDVAEIFRGKSKYMLNEVPNRHILHTTSLKKDTVSNSLQSSSKLTKYSTKIARAGDIVLARVGTSVIGKISIVEKGYFVPTDCVIIIRAKMDFRSIIFRFLSSEEGQKMIHACAKGVAAKHITLSDVENFPIYIKGEIDV